VPKSSAETVQRGNREDELAWRDKKDQPLLMGGDGSIKALDQEGHPMVKDETTNTNSGSLDWKSQEDHPMVKDSEPNKSSSASGDLDWKS